VNARKQKAAGNAKHRNDKIEKEAPPANVNPAKAQEEVADEILLPLAKDII
jgi:hypothetical protein